MKDVRERGGDEGLEIRRGTQTADVNVCSHHMVRAKVMGKGGRNVRERRTLRKLKIELTHNPVIVLQV